MAACPGLTTELVIIKTRGDRDQNSALNKFAGKGIFTKEIEEALLAEEVDLAVHSLKDLPTELPAGLCLAPPPVRADARDLLVSRVPVQELPQGATVGTGSARRREQLRLLRPDLNFCEIRGNVATRVRKWREGLCDATVLACAGVDRLGVEEAGLAPGESRPLTLEQCVPAPCQGILGLEIRENDLVTLELTRLIADRETGIACQAERAFLATLDGGCHIPAGALARVDGEVLELLAFLGHEGGADRVQLKGSLEEAEKLGREAASRLKACAPSA